MDPASNVSIGKETKKCTECSRSFRNCECKSCSKCGCIFRKFTGTNLVKGRSHCRICGSAVCLTCHMLAQGRKICTRCHLKQREDELSKEKALIAIEQAKYGKGGEESTLYSRLTSGEQRENVLFDATKHGDDHVLVTILDLGVDVNLTDSNKNTPLFYAAESGHVTCCALLLERKADVNVTNSCGWTPLHAVAWKGSSDNHIDCAELLLEAGVSALAETVTNETAADLAERCGGKEEIIAMLRAAEVEISVIYLKEKVQALQGLGTKDRKVWRMVTCLLNHVSKKQLHENDKGVERKMKERIAVPNESIFRTASLDRNYGKKNLCQKCGGLVSPMKKQYPGNVESLKPMTDVEQILKANTAIPDVENEQVQLEGLDSASLRDRLIKSEAEKKDWENRCRKLMQSVATNSKEYQRAMELAKDEIARLKEDKEVEIKKCEASFANKLAKVRQEADTTIWDHQKQIEELEQAKQDLSHLQKNLKLTWVPDQLVRICQNHKCRLPFSQTNRKHHCRCCGRVFCQSCSGHKLCIATFGYNSPVRVCGGCYALIDDCFSEACPSGNDS
ncbi:RUN and FYVE domain-containing protein 2-like isoform X1 [Rhopilema esculentum]|uniref:RUN and FYVE domain-containing protein 2-like isoform X1 n=1 Tax=Rhopilema esculentum TaxID=499914 RepID=UPI0031D61851